MTQPQFTWKAEIWYGERDDTKKRTLGAVIVRYGTTEHPSPLKFVYASRNREGDEVAYDNETAWKLLLKDYAKHADAGLQFDSLEELEMKFAVRGL